MPTQVEEIHLSKMRERGQAFQDAACFVVLLKAVIEQTHRDLLYLKKVSSGDLDRNKKHVREKMGRILEHDPVEVVRGQWFAEICKIIQCEYDIDVLRGIADEIKLRAK